MEYHVSPVILDRFFSLARMLTGFDCDNRRTIFSYQKTLDLLVIFLKRRHLFKLETETLDIESREEFLGTRRLTLKSS